MATYNKIAVTVNDNRPYFEGIIDGGSLKPGQIVQIQAGTAKVGGKFTFEVYNRAADGNRPQGPLLVLCENWKLGKTVDDAYVDGEYCLAWCPHPGELIQVLHANATGTADDVAIGDLLIPQDGTGKVLVTTGSPEIEPFMAVEARTDPTADGLVAVYCTGY